MVSTKRNVFYLSEESRWSYIKKNAKQPDIAVKIDTALHTIERNNKTLRGALPDNYFSRIGLDTSKLSALIDTINNIQTLKDKEQDIVGRVYEYFLTKFALAEGKGKGEFYTPKSIVNLIAEIIEPYKGKIYDPCCGSGGVPVIVVLCAGLRMHVWCSLARLPPGRYRTRAQAPEVGRSSSKPTRSARARKAPDLPMKGIFAFLLSGVGWCAYAKCAPATARVAPTERRRN